MMMEDDIELNEEQKNAMDLLKLGYNCFITGSAGTGKSTLIKRYIKLMRQAGLNVVVAAPTGIAALNIGGATIHRTFGYSVTPVIEKTQTFKFDLWKHLDILIIDEVSMLRVDLFELLVHQIRRAEKDFNKKIQVILLGDFFQLPPVITEKDKNVLSEVYTNLDGTKGYCFCSGLWSTLIEYNIVLKNVMRQSDINFIQNLDKIKYGDPEGYAWFNIHANRGEVDKAIQLYSKNSIVDDVNTKKLEEIEEEPTIFKAYIEKYTDDPIFDSDYPNKKEVELKVGARVMSIVNSSQSYCGNGKFQNGSLGTILNIGSDEVTVAFDNGSTCKLPRYTWEINNYEVKEGKVKTITIAEFEQIPLKLAYAITIHKSQGQTYDSVVVDPSNIFAVGQLYVALSRCKDIKGLYLLKDVKYNRNAINYLAIDFMNWIIKNSYNYIGG